MEEQNNGVQTKSERENERMQILIQQERELHSSLRVLCAALVVFVMALGTVLGFEHRKSEALEAQITELTETYDANSNQYEWLWSMHSSYNDLEKEYHLLQKSAPVQLMYLREAYEEEDWERVIEQANHVNLYGYQEDYEREEVDSLREGAQRHLDDEQK